MAHELEHGLLQRRLQDDWVSQEIGCLASHQRTGHCLRHQGRATQRQVTRGTCQHIPSLTTDTIPSLSLSLSVVAKWLRAHDPPAPWSPLVTSSVIEAAAKARGTTIRLEDTAEDSNWEPKEYKPGEYVEQMGIPPKDMPMDLIEEMADWLVSEGAPGAAKMASVSDTLPSPSPPSPSLVCEP